MTHLGCGVALLTLLLAGSACTGGSSSAEPDLTTSTTTATTAPSPYGPGWSAVHADERNSDYADVAGPDSLELAWEHHADGVINLGATTDADGRVYLTSTEPGCALRVMDGATGATEWCAGELDRLAVLSGVLLDRDAVAYIADSAAMHAYEPDGTLRWETPIVGVPLSAQLSPAGDVVFMTNVGVTYLLDSATGETLLEPLALTPGATFDPGEGVMACARGTAACPAANTLAIDHVRSVLYFTYWESGAPQASVQAMRLTEGEAPAFERLWSNDRLDGGSGSSPTLTEDGRRVYVNDNGGAIHALDAETGEIVWSHGLGFATGGSPSLSPDGVIMPAGAGQGTVLALRDDGSRATLLWDRTDLANRGIATQTAGGRAYVTVAAGGRELDLVVVDTETGEELDRDHIPGVTVFSVGTTVGPDGTVYVPTISGDLFAYRSARP